MKLFLLMFLILLCHGKPYRPVDIMDVMNINDIMMQDFRDEDDDDDDDDDDDYDNDLLDCPRDCECSLRVVRCSDRALGQVPEKIPEDTAMLDLQNNYISEIKEDDFKGLNNLYALFLLNNEITSIHPRAFRDMNKLKLLYLSYNMLTEIPANLPKNILELRLSDNNINRIKKDAFKGMMSLQVLEMTANPITNTGIEPGAFDGMSTLFLRIAEAKLTAVPKDLPSDLIDLNLDYNKIAKVEVEDFLRCKKLQRLGLEFNQIKYVENGSLASIPNIREIRLDNNKLKRVPPGLNSLKYLQVLLLHANKIQSVGVNDFCPLDARVKKALYGGISLFANPVRHWQIQPVAFRCVSSRGIHMGNRRK